jgi:hypothetical protein
MALRQARAIALLAKLSTPKGWKAEWARMQRSIVKPGVWKA